ncbi:MAG: hypothetical protein ABIH34_01500 [Nanoarchaeota archaeon]
MKEIPPLNKAYESCLQEGNLRLLREVDKELARSLLKRALDGLERESMRRDEFEKKTSNYSFLFTEHYDILRKLMDAFIMFDQRTSSNH